MNMREQGLAGEGHHFVWQVRGRYRAEGNGTGAQRFPEGETAGFSLEEHLIKSRDVIKGGAGETGAWKKEISGS